MVIITTVDDDNDHIKVSCFDNQSLPWCVYESLHVDLQVRCSDEVWYERQRAFCRSTIPNRVRFRRRCTFPDRTRSSRSLLISTRWYKTTTKRLGSWCSFGCFSSSSGISSHVISKRYLEQTSYHLMGKLKSFVLAHMFFVKNVKNPLKWTNQVYLLCDFNFCDFNLNDSCSQRTRDEWKTEKLENQFAEVLKVNSIVSCVFQMQAMSYSYNASIFGFEQSAQISSVTRKRVSNESSIWPICP